MKLLSVKYSDQPIGLSNHYHDCHQILYIVSGKLAAVINGEEHLAESGDLLILSRFECRIQTLHPADLFRCFWR